MKELSQSIIQYIEECAPNYPAIQEIAKHIGYSPCYVSRRFHIESAKTITQFIDEDKENRAKKKLCESMESIEEIAYSLGFSDRISFSRWFTKQTQCPPARYRRENTKTSNIL